MELNSLNTFNILILLNNKILFNILILLVKQSIDCFTNSIYLPYGKYH